MKNTFADVDSYIEQFDGVVKAKLIEIRKLIRSLVPEAQECIAYQMPAYKLNGPLVYFAGYKNHIGFYPTGSGVAQFVNELGGYKFSKGAIQFPLDAALPAKLIQKIVAFRKSENELKKKKTKKTNH